MKAPIDVAALRQCWYYPVLRVMKRAYVRMYHPSHPLFDRISDPNVAGKLLSDSIDSGKPFMASRFGAVEIQAVTNYLGVSNKRHDIGKFVRNETPEWWWNNGVRHCMKYNAGFFSNDDKNLEKFGRLMIEDMKQIDILLSWQENEYYFREELSKATPIEIMWGEPFWAKEPWTKALRGKKVLVVHPFAEEIRSQYRNKRRLIHKNPDLLPEFELKTVKAVQSIAGGGNLAFKDWFEALDYMKRQISDTDFDVCIIGCGAYGMPLAAHVKRMNKQGIHLGGSVQLLFGIKGKRWETADGLGKYPALMNEHWIRPYDASRFKGCENVEGGCYW